MFAPAAALVLPVSRGAVLLLLLLLPPLPVPPAAAAGSLTNATL
jgi:hypothetical protein